VNTIQAMHDGRVKVFVSAGGNLALAAPDLAYTFDTFRNCELTVHIATKLNRSHLVHGKQALILPCLARTDEDQQAGGRQGVSVEDAMSMVHISYGMKAPDSADMRSECWILAGLAQASLPASATPWLWYAEDYDRIRDTMAQVLDGFEDFNNRVRYPHGFRLTQPARERGFLTPSGRAEFGLAPLPDDTDPGDGRLMLATVRSHDQFNTTIYSNNDRYRGLKGLRTVVFMNADDMRDRDLKEFDLVDITSYSKDGTTRSVYGYRAVSFEVPRGCAAGYMPELNVLCGIADYSTQSGQPATKHVQVDVTRARPA
jgi:anaerobic selenocysteine-containing dehydrogenase